MTRVATHHSDDLGERLIGVEHGLESLERRLGDRLDSGAQRFATINRQLEEIEARLAPKPTDKYKVAGFVLAVALALLPWVWQAARYPDRSEYAAFATKVENAGAGITERLQEMREIQLEAQADLRLLQQRVESLQKQIDQLQSQHPKGNR